MRLATSLPQHVLLIHGADGGSRTHDPLFTKQPLWPLSYVGIKSRTSRLLLKYYLISSVFSTSFIVLLIIYFIINKSLVRRFHLELHTHGRNPYGSRVVWSRQPLRRWRAGSAERQRGLRLPRQERLHHYFAWLPDLLWRVLRHNNFMDLLFNTFSKLHVAGALIGVG
jgi:hypothetical protein